MHVLPGLNKLHYETAGAKTPSVVGYATLKAQRVDLPRPMALRRFNFDRPDDG